MAEPSFMRDFVQVKFAYRIRRLAREELGRECVWVRFEHQWYGRTQLIERLGIANGDGVVEWIADYDTRRGKVKWTRPAVPCEAQQSRGECAGWECGVTPKERS